MKVAIFGTGYVGLVTGACLAEIGHHVTCVDVDADKIARLQKGENPIFEQGLSEILATNIAQGRLTFTTDGPTAVAENSVIMSAVGTPPMDDGSADLQYVLDVAATVAHNMDDYRVVITKSTVPVKTGDLVEEKMRIILAERGLDVAFDVVSNPEFLKEGSAVDDFRKPDRIVIGTDAARAREMMRDLYGPLMRQGERFVWTDRVSAEMIKYAANAMLATKISFMNNLSQLAEKVGANIEAVRTGIGSDPRIGQHFIYPGPGYGGSCFPKDVKALIRTGHEYGVDLPILTAVEDVNVSQAAFFAQKIIDHYDGDLAGTTLAVWGLAFKENTDDVRESPAEKVLATLVAAGATIRAYDPQAMETFKAFTAVGKDPRMTYMDSEGAALEGADALVILTAWKQFRAPDYTALVEALQTPVIFDARNLYKPEEVREQGITYVSIGRPTA